MRIALLVLLIAVGVVVVNDGGRYARTRIDLAETTDQIVEYASGAPDSSRKVLAGEVQRIAEEQGARVSQFVIGTNGVEVWTEDDVTGTWVLGPVLAWRNGQPSSTDPIVTDYGSSGL